MAVFSAVKSVPDAAGTAEVETARGAVIRAIDAVIVDLPTIRPHRLSMTTM